MDIVKENYYFDYKTFDVFSDKTKEYIMSDYLTFMNNSIENYFCKISFNSLVKAGVLKKYFNRRKG